MNIYRDLHESGYPRGWESVFKEADKSIRNTCRIIEEDGIEFTPVSSKVFAAYEALGPDDVEVVILGEGPYPTRGHAEGLSFSCSTGSTPKSLVNVYKELASCIPGFVTPRDGNLKRWCDQGVMLLNVSLVTKVGSTNYKNRIWMPLIKATIDRLTAKGKVIWKIPVSSGNT